ncbi:MAG TPA: hypothetical protein VI757_06835 [Bacteroidia bacterium]|nr:hypothetical protein [Bacteroidia bacterium]
MKRLLLITVMFIFFSAQLRAQYHAAVGLRGGKFTSGITAKYFFFPDNASGIELMLGRTKIAKGGWLGAAFYEHQFPLRIPILQLPVDFIGGVGVHAGYYPKRYYKIVEGSAVYYNDKCVSFGMDAIIGLEYLVPIVWLPFAVGIEAQPFVEFVNQGPEHLDFAITLKYVFN